MKFKMAPNSVFAILLRNPWWVSFLLAAVISLLCAALLPKEYVAFGIISVFPFLVIGCVALKRQWSMPSPAAVEAETARLAGLSWKEFANELEAKFAKQGYAVERLNGGNAAKGEGAADFRLTKAGQTILVAAKRYKAATHGVEALQALVVQKEAQGADRAMYVCLGALSEQAEKFARDNGVTVGLGSFWA
jgi:restriction system protein